MTALDPIPDAPRDPVLHTAEVIRGFIAGTRSDNAATIALILDRAGLLANGTAAAQITVATRERDHYERLFRRADEENAVAEARIAELEVALAQARESGGWMPIKTAPKVPDQDVLLYGVLKERRTPWRYTGHWFQAGKYDGWWTVSCLPLEATHWRPLPAPPEATP